LAFALRRSAERRLFGELRLKKVKVEDSNAAAMGGGL